MAFTGVAVIKQVADNMVRITGLSLAGGAAGTISLNAGAGQVKCPANFEFTPYTIAGSTVTSADAIDVSVKTADLAGPSAVNVAVTKAGTVASDFLATLTNLNSGSSSGNLEIYVKFHS